MLHLDYTQTSTTEHLQQSHKLPQEKTHPPLSKIHISLLPNPCQHVILPFFHNTFTDTYAQKHSTLSTHNMNQTESLAATIALLQAIKTPNKVKATLPLNYSAKEILTAHPAFPKTRLFYSHEDIYLLAEEHTKSECQILFDYELTIQQHPVGRQLDDEDKRFKPFLDTVKYDIIEHYMKHDIHLQRPYIIPVTTYFPPTHAAKVTYRHYLSYPATHEDMIKMFSLQNGKHLKHTHLAGVLLNNDPLEYAEINPYALIYAGCTHINIPDLRQATTDPFNELPGLTAIEPHRENRSDYSTIQVKFSTIHFFFKAIRDNQRWLIHPTDNANYGFTLQQVDQHATLEKYPNIYAIIRKKGLRGIDVSFAKTLLQNPNIRNSIHSIVGATAPKTQKTNHPHHSPGQFLITFQTPEHRQNFIKSVNIVDNAVCLWLLNHRRGTNLNCPFCRGNCLKNECWYRETSGRLTKYEAMTAAPDFTLNAHPGIAYPKRTLETYLPGFVVDYNILQDLDLTWDQQQDTHRKKHSNEALPDSPVQANQKPVENDDTMDTTDTSVGDSEEDRFNSILSNIPYDSHGPSIVLTNMKHTSAPSTQTLSTKRVMTKTTNKKLTISNSYEHDIAPLPMENPFQLQPGSLRDDQLHYIYNLNLQQSKETQTTLSQLEKQSLSRHHKLSEDISTIKTVLQKLLKKQDQMLEYLNAQDHSTKRKRHTDEHTDNDTEHPGKHTKSTISEVPIIHTSPLFSPFLVTWRIPPNLPNYFQIRHNHNLWHKNTYLFTSYHDTSVHNAQPYNLKGDGPRPPPHHPTELLGITLNSKRHKNMVKRTALEQYINTERPDILVICEDNLTAQETKSWSRYTLTHLDHPMTLYSNPAKMTNASGVVLALSNRWITHVTTETAYFNDQAIKLPLRNKLGEFVIIAVYFSSPNAHLNSEDITIRTQARQTLTQLQATILNWITAAKTRNAQVILMGDLNGVYQSDLESFIFRDNTWHSSQQIRIGDNLIDTIISQGHLIDPWRMDHPNHQIHTQQQNSASGSSRARLDWILVSPMLVNRINIFHNTHTRGLETILHNLDHQPVSFTLDVEGYMPQRLLDTPPLPITLQKRVDHCKATKEHWDNLKDYYHNHISTIPEPSTPENTSDTMEALLRLTFKAMEKHLPMRIMSQRTTLKIKTSIFGHILRYLGRKQKKANDWYHTITVNTYDGSWDSGDMIMVIVFEIIPVFFGRFAVINSFL